MIHPFRNFTILSWNVHSLGQSDKCVVVRDNIAKNYPQLICLEETKLVTIDDCTFCSFIPSNLDAYRVSPADGSFGGLLTAWFLNLFTIAH